MARIVTRPQRFTPEEWKLASKVKHKNTERDRSIAERLILECDRLDVEGRGTVDRTLADVNTKLGQFNVDFARQETLNFFSRKFRFFIVKIFDPKRFFSRSESFTLTTSATLNSRRFPFNSTGKFLSG